MPIGVDAEPEIQTAFMWPYGPDVFEDPVLAYAAPIAVVIVGALLVTRWRDLPLVAVVADAVFVAGFFIQFPGALEIVARAPGDFLAWQMIWMWFAIFFAMALAVHGLKRAGSRSSSA